MPWLDTFDRAQVLAAIEEASGAGISVDDTRPDTLIAQAQALGLQPVQLQIWIYDKPTPDWTAAALTRWARRNGMIPGTESNASIPPTEQTRP